MVDFDALHDMLNGGNTRAVGEAMADWHPAILGELLEQISFAKRKRYPGGHPDYDRGLEKAIKARTR